MYVWNDGDEPPAGASPLEWLRSFGGFLLWLAGLRPLDGGDGRP
jgi:hypothetical protein